MIQLRCFDSFRMDSRIASGRPCPRGADQIESSRNRGIVGGLMFALEINLLEIL